VKKAFPSAAAVIAVLVLVLIPPGAVNSQTIPTGPDDILREAKLAMETERYDRAFEILRLGKKEHPLSFDILSALGNLYFEKELYTLALGEYLAAEALEETDKDLLNKIALSYGHLNREKESSEYYERICRLYPEDKDAVTDLAWMYFKTHQLEKGKNLLLTAAEKFGMNRRFAMTLGTLYADLYDYGNAKKYYELSIEEALGEKETRFASVAYYNLSLVEKSFYNYNSALENTSLSIFMEDRATGHLAKGELYESSLDFHKAFAEYLRAETLDATPLSRVNLAGLYRRFGFFPEALAYARDVAGKKDFSWMYYFGTNKNRFLMDLHELFEDIYRGMAHLESMRPEPSIWGGVLSIFRGLRFRVLEKYHRIQYQRHAGLVAERYLKQKNYINAWFTYSLATRDMPGSALRYLARARDMETAINPGAERFYLLDEGKIRKDPELLSRAVGLFVVPWEKERIEEGLRALVPELDGRKSEAAEVLLRLFELNPGALRQYGFRLPAHITVTGLEPAEARRLAGYLEKAGFDRAAALRAGRETAPVLTVRVGPEETTFWTLEGGKLSRPVTYPAPLRLLARDRRGLAELAREIADAVLSIRR
jgi:tetratricopeptide (TPR) repeat protein